MKLTAIPHTCTLTKEITISGGSSYLHVEAVERGELYSK